jgi:hypothetical protein
VIRGGCGNSTPRPFIIDPGIDDPGIDDPGIDDPDIGPGIDPGDAGIPPGTGICCCKS